MRRKKRETVLLGLRSLIGKLLRLLNQQMITAKEAEAIFRRNVDEALKRGAFPE